ncbi:MAG: oxidoreductase, partial [Mycobacterium sp.]
LGVPEVGWMRRAADYREAARGFAAGTPDGIATWLVLSCRAMRTGAQEALSIAESLTD